MLTTALSAVGSRLDSKFMTAYWLPAFVGFLGVCALLVPLVGTEQIDFWRQAMESVEKAIFALFIALSITLVAFFLRALTRPIGEIFAGFALPGIVAKWSTDGQLRTKRLREQGTPHGPVTRAAMRRSRSIIEQAFPSSDADVQPTRFGNVLASVAEQPRLAYAIEAFLWWPRLSPVLPDYFQTTVSAAQAPMVAMLNLCIVFGFLAVFGALVLALFGELWAAAIIVLVGGLGVSWLCYRAALRQAQDYGNLIRVGFDLYRHEILRQMNLEIPTDLADERALWRRLTSELLGIDLPAPDVPSGPVPGESSAAAASA